MKENGEFKSEFEINTHHNDLISCFDRYMDNVRGFASGTRKLYCRYASIFLQSLLKERKSIDLIRPQDVIKFILSFTKTIKPKSAKCMTYSLRSFFRFLKQTQGLKANLVDCVPIVAAWKPSSFPVTLSVEETQKLLNNCNINSKGGLRDFAVLMLLVRLGLRSCEICRLTLDDINWDKSEILIRGKGSTEARFPIFQDLGNALVAYLQHGRPDCLNKSFFICIGQPIRGFQSSSTVKSILRRALIRANLNPEKKGVHLLRHSFATQLLRQGTSLQEIAIVLRHKSINTTSIYARADFDKLKMLALPWPGNFHKGNPL